jgi:hypothetical protein
MTVLTLSAGLCALLCDEKNENFSTVLTALIGVGFTMLFIYTLIVNGKISDCMTTSQISKIKIFNYIPIIFNILMAVISFGVAVNTMKNKGSSKKIEKRKISLEASKKRNETEKEENKLKKELADIEKQERKYKLSVESNSVNERKNKENDDEKEAKSQQKIALDDRKRLLQLQISKMKVEEEDRDRNITENNNLRKLQEELQQLKYRKLDEQSAYPKIDKLKREIEEIKKRQDVYRQGERDPDV